jgi:hypothetical protein
MSKYIYREFPQIDQYGMFFLGVEGIRGCIGATIHQQRVGPKGGR